MREVNKRMLAAVDDDVYSGFIKEQVKLVGGCEKFYELLDIQLCKAEVLPFFKEEQRDLLEWREEFFRDKFKSEFFGDSYGESVKTTFFWFTDGNDDAHCMDTIPYQITQNFDELMQLAASTVTLNPARERIYLECYEGHESKKLFYDYDQSSVLTIGVFNNQGIPIFSAGGSTLKADSLRILGGQFSRMINTQQQIGDQLMKIKLQKCSKTTTKDRLNTAGSGDLLKDDDCLKTKSIKTFYEFSNKLVTLESYYPRATSPIDNIRQKIEASKNYYILALVADRFDFNQGELTSISEKIIPRMTPYFEKALIRN